MSSVSSGMFRRPYFTDRRRSLRLQMGVMRVLRDELAETTDPDRTATLLQQLDEELDRMETMIEDALEAE